MKLRDKPSLLSINDEASNISSSSSQFMPVAMWSVSIASLFIRSQRFLVSIYKTDRLHTIIWLHCIYELIWLFPEAHRISHKANGDKLVGYSFIPVRPTIISYSVRSVHCTLLGHIFIPLDHHFITEKLLLYTFLLISSIFLATRDLILRDLTKVIPINLGTTN